MIPPNGVVLGQPAMQPYSGRVDPVILRHRAICSDDLNLSQAGESGAESIRLVA